MGFELPDGKTARNIYEQVKFLTEKLADLYAAVNELGIKIEKVDVLPDEGEARTIYLVPVVSPDQDNYYEEYIWIDDAWEMIGTTKIDLSGYVTLDTDQTITGAKTFQKQINISNTENNNKVYIKNSSNYGTMGFGPSPLFDFSGGNISFYGDLRTTGAGTKDIGQPAKQWKDLYLSGKIQLNEHSYITSNTDYYINVAAHFSATANNSWDLGNSGLKWRNLYLAGNITDGTNSVTVADLAALITYAKAQGWIS